MRPSPLSGSSEVNMKVFLAVLALVIALTMLTGCAVNIVVAPNATFAVGSLNQADDNRTATQYNET